MDKSLTLLNNVTEATTIKCNSCEKEDISDSGAEESVETFHELGWRVKKGICLCPDCSVEKP